MHCTSNRTCSPLLDDAPVTLQGLVHAYRIRNRPGALEEIRFFKNCGSFATALRHASLALDHRNKRYSHQFRLRSSVLRHAENRLSAKAKGLRSASSFTELHKTLRRALRGIAGLGELYYYDTAFRLGAHLGLMPTEVYLHRGTRAGAAALGLPTDQETLQIALFPKPIQELEPHEVEDFLCIYKSKFSAAETQP